MKDKMFSNVVFIYGTFWFHGNVNFETNIVLALLGQIWINLYFYKLLILTFATGILIAFFRKVVFLLPW